MKIFTFSLNIQKITAETDIDKVLDSVIDEEVARIKEITKEDLKQAITLIGHRDVMDGERPYLDKEKISIPQFIARHGFSIDETQVKINPWVSEEFLQEMNIGEYVHLKLVIKNRQNSSFTMVVTTNPEAQTSLILEYISVLCKFYEMCDRDYNKWNQQTRIKDDEGSEHRFQWIKFNADGLRKFLGSNWYYEFLHGIERTQDWPNY